MEADDIWKRESEQKSSWAFGEAVGSARVDGRGSSWSRRWKWASTPSGSGGLAKLGAYEDHQQAAHAADAGTGLRLGTEQAT